MSGFKLIITLLVLAPLAGCQEWDRSGGMRVSELWGKPKPIQPSSAPAPREGAGTRREAASPASRPATPAATPSPRKVEAAPGDAIAWVDGVPVARERVVDLLLRSHGAAVLEQIVVLDRAEREAAQRGLQITQPDIDAEYDRWLRNLTNPELAGVVPSGAPLDRAEGERLLERVLALRNISRAEYLAGLRRNAWLRAIVQHDLRFDDAQLEAEYRRSYGERVTARHIQLATAADADRVVRELAAPGADFADLARRNSANADTAATGGLMREFSREDPDVPEAMRRAAFELEPGTHSPPVRIGEWFHLVKAEERHPAAETGFESVRADLEARLRRRESEPIMQKLHQQLLEEARVEITDPVLAEAYAKKYPAFSGTRGSK